MSTVNVKLARGVCVCVCVCVCEAYVTSQVHVGVVVSVCSHKDCPFLLPSDEEWEHSATRDLARDGSHQPPAAP